MKPPLEARARQIVKLANALKSEPPQQAGNLRLEPQGLDGKGRERDVDLAVGNNKRRARIAGKRMRATQGVGNSKLCGEAGSRQPSRHVGKECTLAAEEMRHAADLEPETIAIDIQSGAVAARRPAGEVEKRLFILVGRSGEGEKVRTNGAGIGEAEAVEETLADARRIDRSDDEPALPVADERQRPVIF